MKLDLSIGILSWKSHANLHNTLLSYRNFGLLDIVTDIKILFQEISHEDIKIANYFNIKYIGLENNIGIGQGFLKLCEHAENDNILLLENDWILIENKIMRM